MTFATFCWLERPTHTQGEEVTQKHGYRELGIMEITPALCATLGEQGAVTQGISCEMEETAEGNTLAAHLRCPIQNSIIHCSDCKKQLKGKNEVNPATRVPKGKLPQQGCDRGFIGTFYQGMCKYPSARQGSVAEFRPPRRPGSNLPWSQQSTVEANRDHCSNAGAYSQIVFFTFSECKANYSGKVRPSQKLEDRGEARHDMVLT